MASSTVPVVAVILIRILFPLVYTVPSIQQYGFHVYITLLSMHSSIIDPAQYGFHVYVSLLSMHSSIIDHAQYGCHVYVTLLSMHRAMPIVLPFLHYTSSIV